MTLIAHPDRIISADDADDRVHIMQDIIISRTFAFPGAGHYGTVVRLNSAHDPVWVRQLFMPTVPGDTFGRECALTRDGRYLYVVGADPTPGTDNFYKLDARTGETIWSGENTAPFFKVVADVEGNAIIFGWHLVLGVPTGWVKKYLANGALDWTVSKLQVNGMATDSECSIYLALGPEVGGFSIQKYDRDGGLEWSDDLYAGASYAGDIAVNKDDEIFVVGGPAGVSPNFHRIFKYLPADNTQVASAIVNTGTQGNTIRNVECDSEGYVVVASGDIVEKFNPALVSQWKQPHGNMVDIRVAFDAHDRVHLLYSTDGVGNGGYMIADPDTGAELYFDLPIGYDWLVFGCVFSKEVYLAEYTDQTINMVRDDICCFQDDEIDEIVEAPDPDQYNDGDIIYHDFFLGAETWEEISGIFESLIDNNLELPGENELEWLTLSNVPPCGNVLWDSFTGYGGIGNAPQLWTISIIGLKKVADSTPSEYNGDYKLLIGPGKLGFLFGVQHDNATRINFLIGDEKDGGGNELLQFGTDAHISSIFNYTDVTSHGGSWSALVSSNLIGTPNAVAFEGTASIYPGGRRTWDATTVFAVDDIVCWHGVFYICILASTNNEPPNAGFWTVL